jgi:hypothetical protein
MMNQFSRTDFVEDLAARIVALLDAEKVSVEEVKGLLALVWLEFKHRGWETRVIHQF